MLKDVELTVTKRGKDNEPFSLPLYVIRVLFGGRFGSDKTDYVRMCAGICWGLGLSLLQRPDTLGEMSGRGHQRQKSAVSVNSHWD
jgi:hypothetical protein